MRKIIIIALVVAAVGLAGAPYLSGFIAEKETRNLANTLNEDGRYGDFDPDFKIAWGDIGGIGAIRA